MCLVVLSRRCYCSEGVQILPAEMLLEAFLKSLRGPAYPSARRFVSSLKAITLTRAQRAKPFVSSSPTIRLALPLFASCSTVQRALRGMLITLSSNCLTGLYLLCIHIVVTNSGAVNAAPEAPAVATLRDLVTLGPPYIMRQ